MSSLSRNFFFYSTGYFLFALSIVPSAVHTIFHGKLQVDTGELCNAQLVYAVFRGMITKYTPPLEIEFHIGE